MQHIGMLAGLAGSFLIISTIVELDLASSRHKSSAGVRGAC